MVEPLKSLVNSSSGLESRVAIWLAYECVFPWMFRPILNLIYILSTFISRFLTGTIFLILVIEIFFLRKTSYSCDFLGLIYFYWFLNISFMYQLIFFFRLILISFSPTKYDSLGSIDRLAMLRRTFCKEDPPYGDNSYFRSSILTIFY